jgi:hypothetical protein
VLFVEEDELAVCAVFDSAQLQASGILGLPVDTQVQVNEAVFWTKCSLLIMVPPRAVHTWALDPNALGRNAAGLVQWTVGSGG